MNSLTKTIRAWRVLYRYDQAVYVPTTGTVRTTILAESPDEAITLARLRHTYRITGYLNVTHEPTILDVKPFVRLAEL